MPQEVYFIKASKTITKSCVSEKTVANKEGAVALAREILGNNAEESLVVIGLTNSHHPAYVKEFTGVDTSVTCAKRDIARALLISCATSCIIIHNHPSEYGKPRPSYIDQKFTKELVEALNAIGIELLDHFVINADGSQFTSIKNKEEV
jgi:DNA repair protein RadC